MKGFVLKERRIFLLLFRFACCTFISDPCSVLSTVLLLRVQLKSKRKRLKPSLSEKKPAIQRSCRDFPAFHSGFSLRRKQNKRPDWNHGWKGFVSKTENKRKHVVLMKNFNFSPILITSYFSEKETLSSHTWDVSLLLLLLLRNNRWNFQGSFQRTSLSQKSKSKPVSHTSLFSQQEEPPDIFSPERRSRAFLPSISTAI